MILTPTHLVFKGNEIVSCGKIIDITSQTNIVEDVSIELKNSVFTLDIEVDKIKDVFVGHDELFGRRHLIFPKLRIATSSKIWYFALFDKSLKSKKGDVEERATNMKAKIGQAKKGELSDGGAPVSKAVAPKVIRPTVTSQVPIATVVKDKPKSTTASGIKAENLKKLAKKPTVVQPTVKKEEPKLKNIERLKEKGPEIKPKPKVEMKEDRFKVKKSVAEIIQDKQDEVLSKKSFKITKVKPYEPQAKTTYSPMAQVMKPTKIEDKEDKYLDDLLLDMSDEVDMDILQGELSQASADTSINRCPHCGWMLAWNSISCPKCKKRVDSV